MSNTNFGIYSNSLWKTKKIRFLMKTFVVKNDSIFIIGFMGLQKQIKLITDAKKCVKTKREI